MTTIIKTISVVIPIPLTIPAINPLSKSFILVLLSSLICYFGSCTRTIFTSTISKWSLNHHTFLMRFRLNKCASCTSSDHVSYFPVSVRYKTLLVFGLVRLTTNMFISFQFKRYYRLYHRKDQVFAKLLILKGNFES